MQYLKRNTKFSILAFLIIVLSITISISTLAKTKVYFSLYDHPQKEIIKNINQAQAFINIAMYVFTDKEIALPLIDAHILLTGSYNWTFSANNRNDKNLLVIDDPELIEIFQNQFVNLWTNKYSLERTKELFDRAKIDFLPTSPTSAQTGPKVININSASPEELTSILQISESPAQKIITLRKELGGFKDPKDLVQLPELTNLEWEEWKEEGIIISVK
jgi:phosphatidylserine/phosphatidylglycerophosphate/cardiolipin synthase-like enzyme